MKGVMKKSIPCFVAVAAIYAVTAAVPAAQQGTYFPPAGNWAKKAPAELGLDPVLLQQAVDYAKSRESNREMDFSDQERIFGTLLGSVPNIRAKTNGVVIYKGYVVAEFGDSTWVDPTYSVAKSMLASVMGIAVRDGLVTNLDEPVGAKVKDGGYDSPRNAQVTWKHHLQQVSEWEGNMFGKQDNFIGKEAFGQGEMKPREQMRPGTHYEYNDVRINRFGLSLLRVFNKPVPDVFRAGNHGPDRRVEHVALDSVSQQLGRSERPQGGVGQRRHALGWRRVDQFVGYGALRLPMAARRQMGRQADSYRRRT